MTVEHHCFVSGSAGESHEFGRMLGQLLAAGDLVALYGELGSGKTVLVQGIASGLGYEGYVSSPSFVIVNEYPARVAIFHVDLYRIHKSTEVADLGYREIFFGSGVALVEWAERAADLLPEERLDVEIEIEEPERRAIRIVARGDRYVSSLGSLTTSWREWKKAHGSDD